MVAGFVNNVAAIMLVDTGASVSILNADFYRRLLRNGCKLDHLNEYVRLSHLKCADGTPMPIIATVAADLKLGGLTVPAVFLVFESLCNDVLLGLELLEECGAVIDMKTKVMSLFDGLTSVPMTREGRPIVVRTVTNSEIPPYSESVISVNCVSKPRSADYMIEGDVRSPCKSLLVARTVVDTSKDTYPCRVMNPTEKILRLKPKTPVGILTPVKIEAECKQKVSVIRKKDVPMSEKLEALNAKALTLEGTVLQGGDLDDLVNLLYDNLDLFATSLSELPGCNLMQMRIDTGNHPPVNQRSYRMTPNDLAEAQRQVDDMVKAGIVTESDSPYNAAIILLNKHGGSEKRLCIDHRGLNATTLVTSWPLPVMSDIVDTLSVQRPTLFVSLDLRAGYWQTEIHP